METALCGTGLRSKPSVLHSVVNRYKWQTLWWWNILPKMLGCQTEDFPKPLTWPKLYGNSCSVLSPKTEQEHREYIFSVSMYLHLETTLSDCSFRIQNKWTLSKLQSSLKIKYRWYIFSCLLLHTSKLPTWHSRWSQMWLIDLWYPNPVCAEDGGRKEVRRGKQWVCKKGKTEALSGEKQKTGGISLQGLHLPSSHSHLACLSHFAHSEYFSLTHTHRWGSGWSVSKSNSCRDYRQGR